MITEKDWARLARFVAGECSAEESEALRRWIASDPERERVVALMQRVSAASGLDPRVWDTGAAWERFRRRAAGTQVCQMNARRPGPRRVLTLAVSAPEHGARHRAWAIAASVVLAMAGGLWMAHHAGAWIGWRSTSTPVAPSREYTTKRAQLAQVRLSDGTTVTLAAESRLVVPAGYGSAHRTVTLDGEAYFDVVHDDRVPFVVHAGLGVVRDLGTTFAVRHYSGDPRVRVVVAEGRVALRPSGVPPAMAPVLGRGDLGQLDSTGTVTVTHNVDVTRYIGWTHGHLTFYDTPLADALVQLGRWYDVRFVLADSGLRARRITMSIPTTSVDGLVEAIDLALHLRAERRGDTIMLHPMSR